MKLCNGCGKQIKWYQRTELYESELFHKDHIPWGSPSTD